MLTKLTHAWPVGTLTVALAALASAGHAEDAGARALVEKVAEAVPKAPFTAKAKLTMDSGVRLLEMSHTRADDVDLAYLEVTAPADVAGTRFLLIDRTREPDQQFMRVRGVQRIIQVTEESRKQPFLGSEFYMSDMVRPELDAYEYRFVGDEQVAGRSCKLVESIPKVPANEPYSKSIMAIDPNDWLVMRTQFFDPKGKLFKVWTLEKVEKIDGVWTPVVQKMANVQRKTESALELSEVKYNVTLPDHIFERGYLTR